MVIVLAALLAAVLLGAAIVSPWIVERLEARRARRELEHAERLAMAADYGYGGAGLSPEALEQQRLNWVYGDLSERLARTASP